MTHLARWSLVAAFFASALGFAFAVGYAVNDDSPPSAQQRLADGRAELPQLDEDRPFDVLNDMLRILRQDFVDSERLEDDIDIQLLLEGAINGLLDSLGDPHTTYIDPDSFRAGRGDLSGTFEGIGANVRQDSQSGRIVIVTPFTGSPAERAGIRPGDVILGVDGESTAGWSVDRAVIRIRGPRGTIVRILVRHTDSVEEEIEIERDEIVIGTVFACPDVPLSTNSSSARGLGVPCPLTDANGKQAPNIAYIHIEQFTSSTPLDLRAVLDALDDRGYVGLILDLRLNPGGLLDATVAAVDLFIDDGVVLVEQDRDGGRREFRARRGQATDLPIVVLIDGTSASGAEVLAAALSDHDRAILIGETTFGKGTVNQLRRLNNGGALYVSIARWLTPGGALIEGVGVEPDIEVILTDEDFDKAALNPDWDPQLFRAIEELRGGG